MTEVTDVARIVQEQNGAAIESLKPACRGGISLQKELHMATKGKREAILAALLSAALVTAAAPGIAADKPEAGNPEMDMHGGGQGMGGMGGMHGMEGMGSKGKHGMGGMMNMRDMMSSCSRMHGAIAQSFPQLPPGNAKLQVQMQAEMMQRMGEILAKYAAQAKEGNR